MDFALDLWALLWTFGLFIGVCLVLLDFTLDSLGLCLGLWTIHWTLPWTLDFLEFFEFHQRSYFLPMLRLSVLAEFFFLNAMKRPHLPHALLLNTAHMVQQAVLRLSGSVIWPGHLQFIICWRSATCTFINNKFATVSASHEPSPNNALQSEHSSSSPGGKKNRLSFIHCPS